MNTPVQNQVPMAQPDGLAILHQTLTKADMIPDGWNDCVKVLNENNAQVKLVTSQSKSLLDLVSDWQKQKELRTITTEEWYLIKINKSNLKLDKRCGKINLKIGVIY